MKTTGSVQYPLVLRFFLAVGVLLSVSSVARAGMVAGDFEARLGNLLVQVMITAVPGNAPVFSARVLSGGTVVQSGKGSFNASAEFDWEASIADPGGRGIRFGYNSERGGAMGLRESLELGFVSHENSDMVAARQAYKPDGALKIEKTFSLAYSLGEDVTREGVERDIKDLEAEVEKGNVLLTEALEGEAEQNVIVQVAEKLVEEKQEALRQVQGQYPSYYAKYNSAVAAERAASKASEAAVDVAYTEIKRVFSTTKGLVSTHISYDDAAFALVEGVKRQVEALKTEVDGTSNTAADEIKKGVDSAVARVVALMNSKAGDWRAVFDEYLADLNTSEVEGLFPATLKVPAIRAVFVKLGPQINKVLNAAGDQARKEVELEQLGPDIYLQRNPEVEFDPTPGENARQELETAQDEREAAKGGLVGARIESDDKRALVASLNAEKTALGGGLDLLSFRGYGVASVAVSGRAAAPARAVMTGVGPDGQKWTYAANVRNDQSGNPGTVLFSALAASGRLVEGGLILDVIGGGTVASVVDTLQWSFLPCVPVGPALVAGTSKTKNVFGLADKLSVSSAVVALGGADEPLAGENRFGAQISSSNTVKRLLLAKNGTELKISPLPSVSFSGKFPYSSGDLRGFQGLFVSPDPMNPAVVEGFGNVLLDEKTSVPVKITVGGSAAGSVPSPEKPSIRPVVVWKGLSPGVLSVQLDVPFERSLTNVALMRGAKVIATSQADAGLASLKIPPGATGKYTVKVTREHVGGVLNPVSSDQFDIFQKTPPVGNFQCLLAYEAFRGVVDAGQDLFSSGTADSLAPDGNPYRARLLVTTTATGAWSGKLEFIDLRQVYDEAGNPAPGWSHPSGDGKQKNFQTRLPVRVDYELKGGFVASADSSELMCEIAIPAREGMPAHFLALSLTDAALGGTFEKTTAASALVPTLKATLVLDPSGVSPIRLAGSCRIASKGVAGAEGRYTATTDGREIQIDYSSGAATVAYSIKVGKLPVTGSAYIGRDGRIALMLPPTITDRQEVSYTLTNENGDKVPGKAWVAGTAYGFLEAKLAVAPAKKPPYEVQGVSRFYLTGSMLEEAAETPGGYRYHTGWTADPSYDGPALGGFGSSSAVPSVPAAVGR